MRVPTELTSVRLCNDTFEHARRQPGTLASQVRWGLNILQLRYPNIRRNEYQRLHRHGNKYDVMTSGSRRWTKIRLPVQQKQWLQLAGINMSAAVEWAVLDAPSYRKYY